MTQDIDINGFSEALNNKLDTDFGNPTGGGVETSVSWGMPDYDSGVTLPNGTINKGNSFIAPFNCLLILNNGVTATGNLGAGIWRDSSLSLASMISIARGNTSIGGATSFWTAQAYIPKNKEVFYAFLDQFAASKVTYYPLLENNQ